jgi:hypothetical protein
MKDLEKIKEFFLKDRAMTAAYEGNTEYFKPVIIKDKKSPSILYVNIAYPEGSGVLSIGGNKTMSGQDRETGAKKALSMGNEIVKKLEAKYNIEDSDVNDLKNGVVQVFAISNDFIEMSTPSLDEAKKETGVDMAKKQLDALGVKYEMSTTDKVRPFKVIYQPINKSDEFYDKFEDIVDLFNLKGVVKSSMNEAKEESLYTDWDQFEKPSKIKVYLNNGKTLEISPLKLKGGKRVYDAILQAFIDDRFDITNKVIQGMINNLSEAKEEDAVDTITMDIPLFIRMLEYSREDAAEDMDLHDVTEKAISLGKERGILQMDDYDEIIGTTEKVVKEEVSFLSLKDDNPFDDIPSIEIQLIDDKEGISSPKAFVNISSMGHGGENGKMEILKNNPALQDKVMKELQIEFQKTFRRVIHSILGEPFGLDEKKVKAEKIPLEKRIAEALDKIYEELCPAGKAYAAKRKEPKSEGGGGEEHSAYLMGRASKICQGLMSGKKKKKKK